MKKTTLIMACAILALAACGGGGGGSTGGGSGTVPGVPTLNNPAVQDLAAFALSEGVRSTNTSGHEVRTANYIDGGAHKTVRMVGSQSAGLLEDRRNDADRSNYNLVGGDSSRQVNHRAYYVGDAEGVVRISSAHSVEAVRGTAAVGLDTETGKYGMGADLWMKDGKNGLYVNIQDGKVDGNKMTFSGGKTIVVNLHPLNAAGKGATNLDEKFRSDVVFSNDGKDAFGKIFGSNKNSGFLVDAGFAATEYKED